jgi:very-short-patch-repair endonuclease
MKTSPQIFMQFCTAMGLSAPVAELQFEPLRRWRFDYSWPEAKIALEVEGGIWSGGRHTRGKGFIGDMAKYNHAARLGWRVLRVQPKELMTLATVQLVREAGSA